MTTNEMGSMSDKYEKIRILLDIIANERVSATASNMANRALVYLMEREFWEGRNRNND